MKHVLQKAGIGVGLMATSLGALAAGASQSLHDFGDAMIYMRVGATPMYATFLPSGNTSTDAVILVEMTQGAGTAAGTWQYYISNGLFSAANNVPGLSYEYSEANASLQSVWNVSASTSQGAAATQTFFGPIGNGAQGAGSTNSASVSVSNGEIMVQFSYSTAVSSQTCQISFNAYVGTDDYLQYQIVAVNDAVSSANWATVFGTASNIATAAGGTYTITTKSGGAATDTVSGTNFANDYGGNHFQTGSSYPIIPTYSYAIIDVTNAGASFSGTLSGTSATGAGVFKTMNMCSSVANSRLALNSDGFVVGARNGMLRVW